MASHHHLWAFPSHPPPSAIIIMAPSAAAAIIIIIDITKIKSLGAYILKMPLNQSNIIGLPCKKSKYFYWGILRKKYFCFLQWGYFHPPENAWPGENNPIAKRKNVFFSKSPN